MKAKTELKAMAWAFLPPVILGLSIMGVSVALGIKGHFDAAFACFFTGLLIAICGPVVAWGHLINDNGPLLRYFAEKEQDTLPPASQKPQPGAWRDEIKEFRR